MGFVGGLTKCLCCAKMEVTSELDSGVFWWDSCGD